MKLKKPKFWDYKKPNLFAYILFPIAIMLQILNSLFKKKYSRQFKIKTICIGNFYIGGTGKTSLSIKINSILNNLNFKSCLIKKFYHNQTDEQNILKNNGKLFISQKRIQAIKHAEDENYNYAILDDGLQDKSILSDINIVCFNNINWIGNGMLIPAGPLRENLNNLKKYDYIFLNGNSENVDDLKEQILRIDPEADIYVGNYKALNIDEFDKNDKYLIFSGIGNHQTFVAMIKNYGLKVISDMEFPDHYIYKNSDIEKILFEAKNLNCKIITTEKDYFRLNKIYFEKIKFIKSELQIINEEKFINSIIKK